MMNRLLFTLPLIMLAISACSSTTPKLIKQAPINEISVRQAQKGVEPFKNQRVRWGGTILNVENLKDKTVIELLSRPLTEDGEPIADSPGIGRFLATTEGFVDPSEYPIGRLLTISGTLTNLLTRPVGEYPYRYPVIEIDTLYLWPVPQIYRESPIYWDPFFDPWHPFYRPYWPHHYW